MSVVCQTPKRTWATQTGRGGEKKKRQRDRRGGGMQNWVMDKKEIWEERGKEMNVTKTPHVKVSKARCKSCLEDGMKLRDGRQTEE